MSSFINNNFTDRRQLLKDTLTKLFGLGFEFNLNEEYLQKINEDSVEDTFCIELTKEVNEKDVKIKILYYYDTNDYTNFRSDYLNDKKSIEESVIVSAYALDYINTIKKEIENEKITQQPSINANVNAETPAIAGGKKRIKRTTKKRSSHK